MFKVIVCLALMGLAIASDEVKNAKVKLTVGDATGEICFEKQSDGSIKVSGKISGLKPGSHGFHVHEKGSTDDKCLGAGGHFNPHNKPHGAPEDAERHVGDLGNIVADEHGVAEVNITDKVIQLSGENNIIGRAVVVHEGEDDLGRGGFDDSKTTGHAGARVGCGIIESAVSAVQPTLVVLLLAAVIAIFSKNL